MKLKFKSLLLESIEELPGDLDAHANYCKAEVTLLIMQGLIEVVLLQQRMFASAIAVGLLIGLKSYRVVEAYEVSNRRHQRAETFITKASATFEEDRPV